MVPTFRDGILMANDNIEPEMVKKNYREFDDNVFHQFQRLFAFLRWSDRQDYNPIDFCSSFKDWDGNPINVSV
jgi:ubiquitin carboxyl-terminal hydrolase 34